MSAAALLTGLYPPAVRERWGADINREVSSAGIRCWPDTLAGAARLWLHPSDWPETSAGQTRRVLTVMLFAITAATGLLLRTLALSAALTTDVRHPITSLWLAPLLLGVVLAAPLPLLSGEALRRLAAVAVRTLAAPTAAVLAMTLMAWSGLADQTTGLADDALLLYYWLTLGFVALRLCALVARAGPCTALPTTRRLSAALLFIGMGLALAASQSVMALARPGPSGEALAETVMLGILAATAISARQDLRRMNSVSAPRNVRRSRQIR